MQREMCYYTISWLHKACITPGFRFYQHKFSVEFHDTVREFKAARLCCPVKVQELHPNARYIMCYYMQCNICPTITSVQELKQFGYFTDAAIAKFVQSFMYIGLLFGGKYMEFRIIFLLQYSISINTFEVHPPSDSLHNAVVKPKNSLDELTFIIQLTSIIH